MAQVGAATAFEVFLAGWLLVVTWVVLRRHSDHHMVLSETLELLKELRSVKLELSTQTTVLQSVLARLARR